MELKPFVKIFDRRLFRIPDYQRGYAWIHDQYRDFWEDLVNLDEKKTHYMGLLTLKSIPTQNISVDSEEYWLINEHSYEAYHVVDGQQRLTTFIIFLQSLIEIIRELKEYSDKDDNEIFIGSLKLSNIIENYIVKKQEPDNIIWTYKFGYSVDNPSYKFLRHQIFNEQFSGKIDETFYTLNLSNAKIYFKSQLEDVFKEEGVEGLHTIFKKITSKFVFNEYIITDDMDVYIAFETMNNRGKKLSNLELLKNRLIYLTTLYDNQSVKPDKKSKLRNDINNTWKEIYYQLGRNKKHPLNDDDFLKSHWILFFKYSRQKGNDYIRDLLEEKFTPKKIYQKIEKEVNLENIEEYREFIDIDEDIEGEDISHNSKLITISKLEPKEIDDYVLCLKESAKHWFSSFFPEMSLYLTTEEKLWLDRLNRIGIGYFRPLVISLFLVDVPVKKRIKILTKIEHFIFTIFRLNQIRSNYRNSVYYNAARDLYYGTITPDKVIEYITEDMYWTFDNEGCFKTELFYNYLSRYFNEKNSSGFYSWYALKYLMYEYEHYLSEERGQARIIWEPFIRNPKDHVSIEHIYPQSADLECWEKVFSGSNRLQQEFLKGSLGNLLPLSASINSSLQNYCFTNKRDGKKDEKGKIIRHSYKDGSYSEQEVAKYPDWTAETILERGLKIIEFMEERWNIPIKTEEEKIKLLHLEFLKKK